MGDSNQTLISVASDLGLHFLHMSHKKNARLIWVNSHLLNEEERSGI